MHIRYTVPLLAIFPSPNGKLPLRRACGNRSSIVTAVADIVVFGTKVVDINVPVDEVRLVEIWGDPCDVFNTVIKTTAAARIRTIKNTCDDFLRYLTRTTRWQGRKNDWCYNWFLQPLPKAEETLPIFPDLPVCRSSHRSLSLQIMRFRRQYRIFVAYFIPFLRANKKKGGFHLHHDDAIINPWVKVRTNYPYFPVKKRNSLVLKELYLNRQIRWYPRSNRLLSRPHFVELS